jgi:N-carbamoyl-L-amino-acid hydrolase
MGHRADALVAAARFVTALEAAATALAAGDSHFAATVGEFRMAPNAANVIPGHVRLLVDARAEDRAVMQTFLAWLRGEAARIDASGGVRVAEPRLLSDNPASPSDSGLVALLEQAADRMGASRRRLASGAGHDAAWISRKAPACMLFVPSKDGLSHASAEFTDNQAIALGVEVLLEATLALDARPTGGE